MDNKKTDSYEQVHRQLVEAMQKACIDHPAQEDCEPQIDLSFLNEDKKKAKKKKVHLGGLGKVAVIAVVVLLGVNAALLATSSTESYGDKGILHRIYESARGIFTDSEEELNSADVEESLTISSKRDLSKAKKILPELYVPEYMPKGFELQTLTVDKYAAGDYLGEYIYRKDKKEIAISFSYVADDNVKYVSDGNGELIEQSDRKIHIYRDDYTEEYIAEVYTETCHININGVENKKSLLKIAENLEN